MIRLYDASAVRQADRVAIEDYKIPGIVLMENAGKNTADRLYCRFSPSNALILCGRGNNGGDGFVIARHLCNKGVNVKCVLVFNKETALSPDADVNFNVLKNIKAIKLLYFKDITQEKFIDLLKESDVVIDAMLGTGSKGTLRGDILSAVELVNSYKEKFGYKVVAVDIPTGVSASSGKVEGKALEADITYTMYAPKVGLYVEPGASCCGCIEVVDIGAPPDVFDDITFIASLVDDDFVKKVIPKRHPNTHKGSYGKLLIVGGAVSYAGAVSLAAFSAYRAGVGLVYCAVPRNIYAIVEQSVQEAVVKPVCSGDFLTKECLDSVVELSSLCDAIVVGPGLGQDEATQSFLINYLQKINDFKKPVLIDADALNIISKYSPKKVFKKLDYPIVITPHPGEMARLIEESALFVQANRLNVAVTFAKENGVCVLLKGSKTIVSTSAGDVFIVDRGNPGMATGGMGDVLSGVCGAFMAMGVDAFLSAVVGAYVHASAGDETAEVLGQDSVTAHAVAENLFCVLKRIRQVK